MAALVPFWLLRLPSPFFNFDVGGFSGLAVWLLSRHRDIISFPAPVTDTHSLAHYCCRSLAVAVLLVGRRLALLAGGLLSTSIYLLAATSSLPRLLTSHHTAHTTLRSE